MTPFMRLKRDYKRLQSQYETERRVSIERNKRMLVAEKKLELLGEIDFRDIEQKELDIDTIWRQNAMIQLFLKWFTVNREILSVTPTTAEPIEWKDVDNIVDKYNKKNRI